MVNAWHETAAHGMEVGGAAAAELKLDPISGVPAPVSTDASKRVIYQDKMADQDAPQRSAPACKAWLNWLHSVPGTSAVQALLIKMLNIKRRHQSFCS